MFIIETKGLKIILEVVPVDSLRLHEAIIPGVANKLLLELKNWAHLQNPIICGTNHIVLDGHHRTYAFKKLNLPFIPVCKVDYHHENTQVRCWFRLFTNVEDLTLILQLFKNSGGIILPVESKDRLKQELGNAPLSFGIQQGGRYFIVRFPPHIVKDAVTAYDHLERLQYLLAQKGIETNYIPNEAPENEQFCTTLDRNQAVIWTPQITKEMVEEVVENNRCFAPKTTRHIIPARPLHVNVPISWFKEQISLEAINKKFAHFLSKKGIRRLPPGQVINGRYYEEELFVFFDKKS